MNSPYDKDFQVGDYLVRYGNARMLHVVERVTPQFVYTSRTSGRMSKSQFRLAKNSEVDSFVKRQQGTPVFTG